MCLALPKITAGHLNPLVEWTLVRRVSPTGHMEETTMSSTEIPSQMLLENMTAFRTSAPFPTVHLSVSASLPLRLHLFPPLRSLILFLTRRLWWKTGLIHAS